jgi:hypothetical protein
MKNLKITVVLFLLTILCASAQVIKEKPVFVVIDNHILDIKSGIVDKIVPSHIESVTVLKDTLAIKKYGTFAKDGIIEINLKPKYKKKYKNLIKTLMSKNKINRKIKISGIVIDCENQPIPGASIKDENTGLNISSDLDGKFTILTQIGNRLKFSFVGLETKSILILNKEALVTKLKVSPEEPNGEILIKKPIIYLYPTTKTDIYFQLDFKGKLQTTFPKINEGWKVTAYPDGKIFDKNTNRFYNSLFWDGSQSFAKNHYQYQNGFSVKKENLISFLIEKLEFMGLNTTETNDFVQFWLPSLEKNELNFIHFYQNEEYEKHFSKNNIEPRPTTEIRIFMEFYGTKEMKNLPEQLLYSTDRKGFTVIEWGGADVYQQIENNNL